VTKTSASTGWPVPSPVNRYFKLGELREWLAAASHFDSITSEIKVKYEIIKHNLEQLTLKQFCVLLYTTPMPIFFQFSSYKGCLCVVQSGQV
jgi:hypothetical protein